jgi:phage terminase large subunit-like protein
VTTGTVERKAKRAPPPREPSDPVTHYAREVSSGRVLAGRAVRLACDRHLRDLERQRAPDFGYVWSVKAAKHVIGFYPAFLFLEDGFTAFRLLPWQAFCVGSVCGWRRKEDNGRRFQIAYVETGKGSGKSPLLAGFGLYGLAFDGEQSAEIYSAAFDREQAMIILRDAIRMATDSPDLSHMLDIGKRNIAFLETGSFFRAESSEHRSKSGPRPHFVLIDELHEHRDGTVVNKMRAGFKARRQPVLFEITNSGFDRTTICWQHHEHSLSVLRGETLDDQWFAYICQLDPCARCISEGYDQPKDGCPDCDHWTDEAVWDKANPSLGVTIHREYLRRQVQTAQAMPSDQALVKRLNFCLWTESRQHWIAGDDWHACRTETPLLDNPHRWPCAAAFDLSSKIDLTAGVFALRVEDAPDRAPDVVEIADTNEVGETTVQTVRLNYSVELVPYAWIPEETLLERVRNERIPYDVWQRQGWIADTPGAVVDYDAIYARIVKDLQPRWHAREYAYDPWNATQFAIQLRDKARLTVVELKQGKVLSEAIKMFHAMVRSRRIRHNGNPAFAMCIANVICKSDKFGNVWLEKSEERKRIDLALAAVMALARLIVLPKAPTYQMFFLGGT